jgi:hypothetical protein
MHIIWHETVISQSSSSRQSPRLAAVEKLIAPVAGIRKMSSLYGCSVLSSAANNALMNVDLPSPVSPAARVGKARASQTTRHMPHTRAHMLFDEVVVSHWLRRVQHCKTERRAHQCLATASSRKRVRQPLTAECNGHIWLCARCWGVATRRAVRQPPLLRTFQTRNPIHRYTVACLCTRHLTHTHVHTHTCTHACYAPATIRLNSNPRSAEEA